MGINNVEINLDSGKFLSALVEQVRILVLKAVASATKTSVPLPVENKPANGQATVSIQPQSDTAQRGLSTFRSMLNLNPKSSVTTSSSSSSSSPQNPSLLKAQTSALRLNSVLHGDRNKDPASSPLGLRKNLSVHWDSPGTVRGYCSKNWCF